MSNTRTPGPWAATSSYGYPLDKPDSVFTDVTASGEPVVQQCVATGITNPTDAFLLAAAKDLYAACEMSLFIIQYNPEVAAAMKDFSAYKNTLISALKKAEGV